MDCNLVDELKKQALYEMFDYPYIEKNFKWLLNQVYYLVRKKKLLKEDHFTWANALVAKGFLDLFYSSDNDEYLGIVSDYCSQLLMRKKDLLFIDDSLNGYIVELMLRITAHKEYEEFSDKCFKFLQETPKDEKGSLIYRPGVSNVIIIDSLGMVCPFLFAYAKRTGNEAAREMALCQINNYIAYGFDKKTKLPYHGFDAKRGIKHGIIGWGRAVGWIMVALADSLGFIEKGTGEYYTCERTLKTLIEEAIKYQSSDGYIKWQLQAQEGLSDSSATAMIFYSIAKSREFLGASQMSEQAIVNAINAVRSGILDGVDTRCSGASGGYCVYSQKYGSYPWGTGSILSLLSTQNC